MQDLLFSFFFTALLSSWPSLDPAQLLSPPGPSKLLNRGDKTRQIPWDLTKRFPFRCPLNPLLHPSPAALSPQPHPTIHPHCLSEAGEPSNHLCSEECSELFIGQTQQLHKWTVHLNMTRLRCTSTSNGKGAANVHILDREDRWFDRGVKEEANYAYCVRSSLNMNMSLRLMAPLP